MGILHAITVFTVALVAAGCSAAAGPERTDPAPDLPCTALFGQPSDATGLDAQACGPGCACGATPWTPPAYGRSDVEALGEWTLLNPPEVPEEDPYLHEVPEPAPAGTVCAVMLQEAGDKTYSLRTFEDGSAAGEAGGHVTHTGACGLCSSLQDLAVYMANPDLTDPVRACGIRGMVSEATNVACLGEIGFDEPCTWIWYFNTAHTRQACFDVCIAHLDATHHQEDGSLNPCLQCDEDTSGPVFKAIAGRTRRNSGLLSALCRPCETVSRVDHDYLRAATGDPLGE